MSTVAELVIQIHRMGSVNRTLQHIIFLFFLIEVYTCTSVVNIIQNVIPIKKLFEPNRNYTSGNTTMQITDSILLFNFSRRVYTSTCFCELPKK